MKENTNITCGILICSITIQMLNIQYQQRVVSLILLVTTVDSGWQLTVAVFCCSVHIDRWNIWKKKVFQWKFSFFFKNRSDNTELITRLVNSISFRLFYRPGQFLNSTSVSWKWKARKSVFPLVFIMNNYYF